MHHPENSTPARQPEEELRKRIAYERMLAGISAKAVAFDHLGDLLGEVLRDMGETLDVSRVYISEYSPATDSVTCTFEWVSTQEKPSKEIWRDLTAEDIPWSIEALKKNRVVNVENTDLLPEGKGKEVLRNLLSKSFLEVPLFVREELFGCIGFEQCRSPPSLGRREPLHPQDRGPDHLPGHREEAERGGAGEAAGGVGPPPPPPGGRLPERGGRHRHL